ncbi:XRE family transcriptional regulator [Phytopseudomonas seleniipraecipitans]|jgi:phage repressor protein C with HTH and peptisase S24 domain|uniref:Phage repressor protein C, contains Cro/C1-type HTH and peptisase s24 domains n=1 Tax=Phytopseudomonas seleniipraecipitans TaxID=640205 RepID=A0A1G7L9Z0_9GAMM|nr:XRE family transcriptional regulator [Pseudomonas seleniipraecipitans]SDF46196.1 Phage repressor protein C, contains Cro/C1-type HTH and peptisase s24 domains [Pseudomonas seleniipraecipitans]
METLGQRIKHLRKSRGLSQQALAEACGWSSQSRIGNYESDLREPSLADLLLLAPALGVSIAELAGSEALPVATDTLDVGHARGGAVPVVGHAQLGTQGYFEEIDFPVGHGDGYLRIHSDDPNAYGLRVSGDSMHPRIKNGEYVLIEPNKPFHAGDEVMVRTLDGQAMIKEFIYLRDGMYRFDSVNQNHPPIHIPQGEVSKVHLVGGILKSSRFAEE